jgi:hypothetical protein
MRVLTILTGLVLLGTLGAASAARAQESGEIGDVDDVGSIIIIEDHSMDSANTAGGYAADQQASADDGSGAYWYYGAHPDGEGGWDATEGAHQHDYPPFDPYLFTEENGYYYFIGDPVDFGYRGQDVYGFYGPHPIALAYGGGYCYYGGAHRHRFAPWGSRFANANGWYMYQGPVSPFFYQNRDRYTQYFRDVYPHHFRASGGPIVRVHAPGQRRPYQPPIQRMKIIPRGPTTVVPSHRNPGTPSGRPSAPPGHDRDHRH